MIRVWYHARCADGFGAAYALWRKLGDTVVYVPVNYGDAVPEFEAGDAVWIVDFSFPRESLLRVAAGVDELTVIDHHETAEKELRGLPFAHFDFSRSGAVATWEHVHNTPTPRLLLYVQDRDLWRWKLPHSKAINMAIRHAERTFEAWAALRVDDLRRDGKAMMRILDATVSSISRQARPMILDEQDVLAANSSCFASELGHVLTDGSPSGIGAVWSLDGERVRWELRSGKGGPNVGELAETFGGGGRHHTAGFHTDLAFVARLIEKRKS